MQISNRESIDHGLMLDRISLSVKNNWFDEKNRAYIYFSIEDVMELLGCGKNKAVKCMKELDEDTGIGLTRKRRQGFGKSNMIYVKTFLVETQAEKQTSVTEAESAEIEETKLDAGISESENGLNAVENNENSADSNENSLEKGISGGIPEVIQAAEKFDNQTNEGSDPDTEVYISNIMKFKNQTSRSPKNKLQEVYISNSNNTEYIKTEYSDLKSYRILSGDTVPFGDQDCDEMRYDHNNSNWWEESLSSREETGEIYALIRENINLDDLLISRKNDRDLIMEIYNLIVEMVACRSDEIVIASNRYPAEIVRSRFLKLRYDHVIYVMDCLEKNTSKVKNIRKYLLATLFNAPVTMDGYYRAEVRHDMPYLACGRTL